MTDDDSAAIRAESEAITESLRTQLSEARSECGRFLDKIMGLEARAAQAEAEAERLRKRSTDISTHTARDREELQGYDARLEAAEARAQSLLRVTDAAVKLTQTSLVLAGGNKEFSDLRVAVAAHLAQGQPEERDPRCNCPLPYRAIKPEVHEESCPVVAQGPAEKEPEG